MSNNSSFNIQKITNLQYSSFNTPSSNFLQNPYRPSYPYQTPFHSYPSYPSYPYQHHRPYFPPYYPNYRPFYPPYRHHF